MLGFRRKPSDFLGNDNVSLEGAVVLLVLEEAGSCHVKNTPHHSQNAGESEISADQML